MTRGRQSLRGKPGPIPILRLLPIALAALMSASRPAAAGFMIEYPDAQRDAAFVGDQACLECHGDLGDGYVNSLHASLRDFEVRDVPALGCESCHGPGSKHAGPSTWRRST